MTAATIATTSNYNEIHGIDTATGYLVDVDGAFLGVDPAVTIDKHRQFIAAATAAARLLRARPVTGTATVWANSHQRLYDAAVIDLEALRGFVHHDSTRWLRDAITQIGVERDLRENGLSLPPRADIFIRGLANESRLAGKVIDHLTRS